MHYDVYSDEYKVSMYHWKQIPEFAGLTEDEIWTIMSRIRKEEERRYEEEAKRKRDKERADDQAYLESHPDDPVISTNPIKIERGVFFDESALDDRKFLTDDALKKLPRRTKWSLDEKKKMYHNFPF